jgi:DNA-binding HxlR family transcriptional regulator
MKKKKFNCPAEMTIQLIGGKWKAILLYNLRKGPRRFGELRRVSPGISTATLASQLKQLESVGFVKRCVVSPLPSLAVEYSLTERGESLRSILNSMIRWGVSHQKDYALGDFGMAVFQK